MIIFGLSIRPSNHRVILIPAVKLISGVFGLFALLQFDLDLFDIVTSRD